MTNKFDGEFYVVGIDWKTRQNVDGHTRLQVCQNCLETLNYKDAQHGQKLEIAQNFDIQEFFSAYSSFFPDLPARYAGGAAQESYTSDWPQVAAHYKASKDFTCESCGVNLESHKHLLHGHHRNGVKNDNQRSNLMALCAACHREQPHHGHMVVSHPDTRMINRLRREQGLLHNAGWDKVFKFCDSGLKGVLDVCRHRGTNVPEVGFDVRDAKGTVVASLELAWPRQRVGLAISGEDKAAVRKSGWRIWQMREALDDSDRFTAEIKG